MRDPMLGLAYLAIDLHMNEVMTAEETQDYPRRNANILLLLAHAARVPGARWGFQVDPEDAARPVVAFVELPWAVPKTAGVDWSQRPALQASWHMPTYAGEYDGHSYITKYSAIREWLAVADLWVKENIPNVY